MNGPVKFSLIYSVISTSLAIFGSMLQGTSMEIFAYTIGLSFLYLVISLAVFAFFGLVTTDVELPVKVRLSIYFLLCLLIVNSVPYFGEHKIMSIELFKELAAGKPDAINVGLHVITLLSFVITSSLLFGGKQEAN